LPPPPPLPPNVDSIKAEEAKKLAKPKRALIAHPGYGKRGNPINLVTNHF
jgi:eukaryotic translation initiation factor 2C